MTNTSEVKAANRRKSPRRRPRTSVRLECRKGASGFGSNITRTVLDLSDTGVRLVISQEMKLKSEVEVVISSYGMRESIKRLGDVRWQVKLDDGSFCVGVEFQKRLSYRDWQTLSAPSG